VRELVVVPCPRGQNESDRQLWAALFGENERFDDGGVINIGVLDEDGALGLFDESNVELADLVGPIVRLVDENGRSANGARCFASPSAAGGASS